MEPRRAIRAELVALVYVVVIGVVVLLGGSAFAQGVSGGFATNDLASVIAYVDSAYCVSAGIQCTSTGHTAAAAASTNHNPVRIVIQVAAPNGSGLLTPLAALDPNLFTVDTPFFPAGAAGVERVSCSFCSQASTTGVYAIFVHPSGQGNWNSGSYFVQVRYETGGQVLYPAIVQIQIP